MTRLALSLTLAILGAALFAGGAAATTVAECQAQIASLRTATADDAVTTFSGKNAVKEETGLLAKLDAASAALPKKPGTAAQKLTDYRTHVETIAAAGKLTSSADLVAGADQAIACVQSLGT